MVPLRNIHEIYFSPTGGTKQVIHELSSYLSSTPVTYDLLRHPPKDTIVLSPDSLAVVGVPVFSGRIPEYCEKMLACFQGCNTPAMAIVVYGNREYDDALLELKNTLSSRGFAVIGAGAFIARHSIFPLVASDRPDAEDGRMLKAFAAECIAGLRSYDDFSQLALDVRGNTPYRERAAVPLAPSGNKKCTGCLACVHICPVAAIDEKKPRKTDKKRCIACAACISVCPENARGFHGLLYTVASYFFEKKHSGYKKPEVFHAVVKEMTDFS